MASNTRGTENFTTILSKVSSLCLHSLFSFFVVPFSLVNYLYIYIKFLSLLRSCSFTSRRSYEATMPKILWNRSVPKNTREYQAWNDSTHSIYASLLCSLFQVSMAMNPSKNSRIDLCWLFRIVWIWSKLLVFSHKPTNVGSCSDYK